MLEADCFEYHPRFLGSPQADEYLQTLWRQLDWSQREITLFGRKMMQPRLIAWYGDPSAEYSYSGLSLTPAPWHPTLLEIKQRVEKRVGSGFNSVLANAYRDGRDSMGWHRDDEKELGPRPCIASVSLGAERRFLLREARGPSRGIDLGHGSLLVMKGESQARFKHSLPKTAHPVGLRINLTYRRILVRNAGWK